ASEMEVRLTVGPLRKELRVFGDRQWFRTLGGPAVSHPTAFEKMPLVYERAFGGWDRRPSDTRQHACEVRNPVGTGFRLSFEEGLPLPNIEDPRALLRGLGDRPPPAGVGF